MCSFVAMAVWPQFCDFIYIGELRENLLGNPSFVKIGPKLSRCLLDDPSMLQCIRRHYIANKLIQVVYVA
jgi:hypothetical protein